MVCFEYCWTLGRSLYYTILEYYIHYDPSHLFLFFWKMKVSSLRVSFLSRITGCNYQEAVNISGQNIDSYYCKAIRQRSLSVTCYFILLSQWLINSRKLIFAINWETYHRWQGRGGGAWSSSRLSVSLGWTWPGPGRGPSPLSCRCLWVSEGSAGRAPGQWGVGADSCQGAPLGECLHQSDDVIHRQE